METGASQSIIFACVFVHEQRVLYLFPTLRCLSFVVSCLFFKCVAVFVERVQVLRLCPCPARFHKHLVDSVIFSAVFTSPTRHLGVLLVNSLTHAHAHTHTHTHTHRHQKHHKRGRHIKGGIIAEHKQ